MKMKAQIKLMLAHDVEKLQFQFTTFKSTTVARKNPCKCGKNTSALGILAS
jgi:hypothetical protein